MAFCADTTWDICICTCEDSQSEHVHCGCNDCNGMPVSRETAFRHRKCAEHSSSRATGNFSLREVNRKGPDELLSSEFEVVQNCSGFGTPKKSGNYLRNVTTVVGLSQSKISILLLMELMDRS